jgi:hypothetical protein
MKRLLIPGRHRLLRLATLSAFLAAVPFSNRSGPVVAQEPTGKDKRSTSSSAQSPYIERQEVRFVTVDLVAQEHGGAGGKGWHTARDLRKEQVHLWLGSREMPLDLFENWCGGPPPGAEVSTGSGAAGSGGKSGTSLHHSDQTGTLDSISGPSASGGDEEQPPSATSHKYVLYFDLQHMTQGSRGAAFHAALDWASRVARPDDEVMIVNGGQSLRVIRPLQPAADGLLAGIRKAMEDFRGVDLWADGELGRKKEVARLAAWPDQRGAAVALARSYASIDADMTRRSLDNLRDLMTLFNAIQGTKNLVFFGETVRLVPGIQYFEPIADTSAAIAGFSLMLFDVYHQLDGAARAANERNVRIYAVQPAGLKMGVDIEGAMTMLATETGGGYVHGTNEIVRIMDRVGQDLDCFYRLGFRISPRHTGRTQRLTVRIGEDSLRYRLRYRRTLMDPTRLQQEQEAILAAYLSPEAAHGFPISVAARRLYDHAGGTRFRIEVSVPLEAIFIQPNPPAGGTATLLFGGQVVPLRQEAARAEISKTNPWLDADPKRRSWGFDRRADIHLPSAQGRGRDPVRVLYATEMDAPPGNYRLVAVAEEPMTRSVAAGIVDLTARASAEILGDPLMAIRDPRTVFIDGASAQPDAEKSAGGDPKRIRPARAAVPAKLDLSGEPSSWTQGPGQLLCPVCLPPSSVPGAGVPGSHAAGWRLLSRVVCGENSRVLPPLDLDGLLADSGCSLVAREVPEEIWIPGPCRVETSLEGERAPQEIRLLEVFVRKDGPAPRERSSR